MDSAIGRQLRTPTWRWAGALAVGLAAVALDLLVHGRYYLADAAYRQQVAASQALLPAFVPSPADYQATTDAYDDLLAWADRALYVRLALVVTAPLALLALARGDRASVGLLEVPRQGWKVWLGLGVRVGAALLLVELLLAVIWRGCGGRWEAAIAGYSDGSFLFAEGCVRAPVFEELLYRLALCVPIAARFGKTPALVVSGSLFALVHVTYGNLNPASAVAGFFLAWVFLRSDCIVLCMLLHALGNLLFGLFLWAVGPGPAQLMF